MNPREKTLTLISFKIFVCFESDLFHFKPKAFVTNVRSLDVVHKYSWKMRRGDMSHEFREFRASKIQIYPERTEKASHAWVTEGNSSTCFVIIDIHWVKLFRAVQLHSAIHLWGFKMFFFNSKPLLPMFLISEVNNNPEGSWFDVKAGSIWKSRE